jgi:hypothetical protein
VDGAAIPPYLPASRGRPPGCPSQVANALQETDQRDNPNDLTKTQQWIAATIDNGVAHNYRGYNNYNNQDTTPGAEGQTEGSPVSDAIVGAIRARYGEWLFPPIANGYFRPLRA